MKRFHFAGLALASSLLLSTGASFAGITLDGTRVVLAAPSKEASILVRNRAPADVMIQSWMDASDGKSDVPFAITPALSRLGAEKQQTLRILYYGQGLPADRESVFWLNVQEIPQKAKADNTLQIAVRQRVKFFYRPAGLPGKVEDAPAQLRWRLVQRDGRTQLEVSNPSAFFVSLASVKVQSGSRDYAAEAEMVPPSSTRQFAIKDLPAGTASAGMKVHFESINDYGAVEPHDGTTAG
ncbi:P pilus assembly chaperone PapD [Burkholderia ambifaria]|uniref:fimbrial biogenesis chaperone n=1 Tax=Burkholderia pyrrocinia TaxID=60550 RepID=UPI0015897A89|nr:MULTISPECIES: molecular chaperone [Burkholderia cepacia complex]MDR6497072.1 P pilus assembly chaperone PapD [Burkholderia ambifaria]